MTKLGLRCATGKPFPSNSSGRGRSTVLLRTVSAAYHLDQHPRVRAFVKNQALGLAIPYLHGGAAHEYVPDLIVRLANGVLLILEPKGHDELKEVKSQGRERWIAAVNADGRYGEWRYAQCDNMNQVPA